MAGSNETCLKAANAGLGLTLKVIWHARKKEDKGSGSAALFI